MQKNFIFYPEIHTVLLAHLEFHPASFEINDTHGFIYRITSGPFAYYDFDDTNYFAALAAWCDKLGYGVLQNIYDSSSSCEDYFAWRMFERYGHAWTLIDEK